LCDVRDEECDTKDVIQMACQNIEKESAWGASHYCKTWGSHCCVEDWDVTRSVVLTFRRNVCLHLWGPVVSMVYLPWELNLNCYHHSCENLVSCKIQIYRCWEGGHVLQLRVY
jgi:hypothetical protein